MRNDINKNFFFNIFKKNRTINKERTTEAPICQDKNPSIDK